MDIATRTNTNASEVTKLNRKVGYAGRWLIMAGLRVGECFKPEDGPHSGKLCVVLAPRYFLKQPTKFETLGQTLATCRPLEARPHPTLPPAHYIYTTDGLFNKHGYRFSEYKLPDLNIMSSDKLDEMAASGQITAYNNPYSALKQHRGETSDHETESEDEDEQEQEQKDKDKKDKDEVDAHSLKRPNNPAQEDGTAMMFIHDNIECILKGITGSHELQQQMRWMHSQLSQRKMQTSRKCAMT